MALKSLGPKRWQVRVVVTDRTGRKRERERICNGPQNEARALEEKIRNELLEEVGGVVRSRLTLTEFSRSWLKRKAVEVGPSTLEKYAVNLHHHILPKLGDRYLDELRPSDIAKLIAEDKGAGNSRLNRLRQLRTMSKDALADGLTTIDFCARVRPPVTHHWTEEDPNLLSSEQLATLLAALPEQWQCMIVVAAFTGLRWCELSALRWEDIDRGKGVIRVRRANWKGRIGKLKTERSRRDPPLSKPVDRELALRRRMLMRLQHPGFGKGWVFPTKTGEPYRGYPLIKALRKACVDAGVLEITPHGLRRTYNDLLRRVADGLVVRSIIGHADEAMTDHYSQVDNQEKAAAAAAVVELVLGAAEGAQS